MRCQKMSKYFCFVYVHVGVMDEMIRIICCDHINKGIQKSLSNTIVSNSSISNEETTTIQV